MKNPCAEIALGGVSEDNITRIRARCTLPEDHPHRAILTMIGELLSTGFDVKWSFGGDGITIRPNPIDGVGFNGEWFMCIVGAHIVIFWNQDLSQRTEWLRAHAIVPSDYRGDIHKRACLDLANPNLLEQITDTLQLDKWKAR